MRDLAAGDGHAGAAHFNVDAANLDPHGGGREFQAGGANNDLAVNAGVKLGHAAA